MIFFEETQTVDFVIWSSLGSEVLCLRRRQLPGWKCWTRWRIRGRISSTWFQHRWISRFSLSVQSSCRNWFGSAPHRILLAMMTSDSPFIGRRPEKISKRSVPKAKTSSPLVRPRIGLSSGSNPLLHCWTWKMK